jgi:hypothetical protein
MLNISKLLVDSKYSRVILDDVGMTLRRRFGKGRNEICEPLSTKIDSTIKIRIYEQFSYN